MSSLAAGVGTGEGTPKLLAGSGKDQIHLLVVMTSERGLCGGFNSSIVKLARARAIELVGRGKTVKILTVGKKGREQLRRDWGNTFVGHVDMSEVKRVGYANAQGVAREVMAAFEAGEADVVTIFYNRFQSVISQIPTALQVIPAKFEAAGSATALYDYEPSEEAILADLLPRAVATQIFTALLENGASEQGARMSAMDNATRNAGDMINRLTIQYNRSRQAAITKELIEIISGAEAL
jgi:F-type H+-transporting ATPase subunit gamma